jgi:hypothetical protein
MQDLFEHLVGSREQRRRHLDAERLRRKSAGFGPRNILPTTSAARISSHCDPNATVNERAQV